MAEILREYSGLLLFRPLEEKVREKIFSAAERYGLALDFADRYLELAFTGRDSNRFVVQFLVELADLLVDAEGEIICEQDTDGVLSFEFFSVKDGTLFRQPAELVRGPKVPVQADSASKPLR